MLCHRAWCWLSIRRAVAAGPRADVHNSLPLVIFIHLLTIVIEGATFLVLKARICVLQEFRASLQHRSRYRSFWGVLLHLMSLPGRRLLRLFRSVVYRWDPELKCPGRDLWLEVADAERPGNAHFRRNIPSAGPGAWEYISKGIYFSFVL